jgi:hypothetical protein
MHAAFQDFEKEEAEKNKKPAKKKPKEYNQMWQNFAYMEE